MKIDPYGGICIFCHKPKAYDYAIHGRGKNATINYFHKECYENKLKYSRKVKKDE